MPSRLSPTVLLAILQPWAEVAEPIHRRLAQLADAASEPARDVLWIGSGSGRSVLWWAGRYQTHIEGVDPDPSATDTAEQAARAADIAQLATFQTADATDLPHQEQVFDIVVVHMLQLLAPEGAAVIAEAARVARPMSTVLAIVPSWLSTPPAEDACTIERLGVRPHLLVEWKSFCRDANIVELTVEDAATDGGWIAAGWPALIARGWRAAGWAGMRLVLSHEFRTIRALALGRVLGLSIIKGTRWPHA